MLFMKQPAPRFGGAVERNRVALALGIRVSGLDPDVPVEEVSTGLPFLIVPLSSLAVMRTLALDQQHYHSLVEGREAKALLAFCPETYEEDNQLNVRMFAPALGIHEDPATGSGNGCLTAYLMRHRYFGTASINLCAEQGYEMGRPSLLYLRAGDLDGSITVHVGGRVIPVASGRLF
jgi:trans-2,3-dihydro-3-hydroxyanthranilate isomerase